jgi:hypothetical protein
MARWPCSIGQFSCTVSPRNRFSSLLFVHWCALFEACQHHPTSAINLQSLPAFSYLCRDPVVAPYHVAMSRSGRLGVSGSSMCESLDAQDQLQGRMTVKKNCTSNYSYTRPDPVRRIPTFVKTFRIHRWALAGPCTWDEIETEKEMRPHMVSAWLWYAGRMLYCAVVSITWAFYRVCGTNELCSKGLVPSEGAKGMLTRQLTRRNSME